MCDSKIQVFWYVVSSRVVIIQYLKVRSIFIFQVKQFWAYPSLTAWTWKLRHDDQSESLQLFTNLQGVTCQMTWISPTLLQEPHIMQCVNPDWLFRIAGTTIPNKLSKRPARNLAFAIARTETSSPIYLQLDLTYSPALPLTFLQCIVGNTAVTWKQQRHVNNHIYTTTVL